MSYYAKTSIDGLMPPYINSMLPLDKNQYKWEPIRVFALQTLIDSENNGFGNCAAESKQSAAK